MTLVWTAFIIGYGALVLFAVACFIASGRADERDRKLLESQHSPNLSTPESGGEGRFVVVPVWDSSRG